jgi:hypothetical protein
MHASLTMLQGVILDPSVLSLLVLVACLTCIYMVFFFGRRLQNSAYIRDSLIESAAQQELKTLVRELDDKALQGPLDPKFPPPPNYGSTRRLWRPDEYGTPKSASSWRRSDETQEQREERLREEEKERQFEEACAKWETEEKIRYNEKREELERIALQRAKGKVPASFDISLLGGGYSFLLEFSTVIVIIFTLLILGVLKIMEGKDISTILAAIAGYVLGKATSEAKKAQPSASDAIKIPDPKPKAQP